MDVFLITMAICLFAAMGGRAQLLVSGLAVKLGPSQMLVAAATVTSITAAILAAFLGSILAQLPAQTQLAMVLLALFLAALELAWPPRTTELVEPTRSLGAISLVLLWRQMTNAPWLCVLVAATIGGSAVLAMAGGAVGVAIAMQLPVTRRGFDPRLPRWRMLRRTCAAGMGIAAFLIAFPAQELIL